MNSMKPNEDAYITSTPDQEDHYEARKPAPWCFYDLYLRDEDSCVDFDEIVKQEDCTALMWAMIVTQKTFDELTDLNRNVLFMAIIDGKWNLVEPDKAEVYLTPWTVFEDRLGHYRACQELSEKLGRCVYPAFLAEEIK